MDAVPGDGAWLLLLFVALPLVGLLATAALPSRRVEAIRTVGWVVPAAAVVVAGGLYARFNLAEAGRQFVVSLPFLRFSYPIVDPQAGTMRFQSVSAPFSFGVDGLSLPLVLMAALVALAAALAARTEHRRVKTFFLFFFLLLVGISGVFLADNLIVFFIFFEFTLVALYFLTAIYGGFGREKAATAFLVMNGLGSLLLFLGFVWIFRLTGTWEMGEIAVRLPLSDVPPGERWALFWLLVVALGVKLPLVPLHPWMLKVHREAPPAVVMLHSGVLLKIGAYGFVRFVLGFFPDLFPKAATALAAWGLLNLLYGAFSALVQNELRLVFAYASVSHMGIVLFGLAALNAAGLMGAVFQMVSHGLISALFFLLLGMIVERTKTSRLDELGGLYRSAPELAGLFVFAALASLGLPALSGFVAEFQAFYGLFLSPARDIALIGLLGLALSAAYNLRAATRTTFGTPRPEWGAMADLRPLEAVPAILLAAAILVIGIYPNVLALPLEATVADVLGRVGG
ncbi:MAG: NADH-ubiquinone oxidoreductase chain M [Hydrogenibacillus schlegelii]|uniref:NADH-ubiquinone oxidoreductase chain M n=1 Tax=Hydrogenibacillus schlegelii TaxID=1484 RepID=A0A2T5GEF3_HYDSH|nr:NADH-quinone oxidoreductase subunit M [Hydrogenibacillus schlegelii]PTQ54577.1 MAG: NADH-ubiquinone oxidoreductase chain M [Hydrogenibacillus schlegelii]